MCNSMRTIVLKLYKPSTRKRKIMDEAALNYTLAFQYLLDKAEIDIENIKLNYANCLGRYNARTVSKWISNDISFKLNDFRVEPFKDSLKIDFASSIAGYLNSIKSGRAAQYPSVYKNKELVDLEYEELMNEYVNGNEENQSLLKKIDRQIAKSNNVRPIFFCRSATNRNYCLLYDALKNKYFAKIYLMNATNENRKSFNNAYSSSIRYISKDKKLFKSQDKKEGFLILPLSFGVWQEQYLKEASKKPETIKTARLIKKNGEYYLSINIQVGVSEKIEMNKYLGISRGIENAINYSIVNKNNVIEKHGVETIYDERIELNILHKLANNIVNLAKENNCQVIMENLVDRGDKLNLIAKGREDFKPQLGCYEYNRLYDILKYKLPVKGLSPPIRVSSTGIFCTCPRCGFNSEENIFSEKILMCTLCGMSLQIEKAGSINLAMKLNKYRSDAIKIKSENTVSGIRLTNKDIGLDLLIEHNNMDNNVLVNELNRIIKLFYENIDFESSKKGFRRKYSIIKKMETYDQLLQCVKIE